MHSDHIENERGVIIYVGDFIIDPMTGETRQVSHIDPEGTLFMTDGGVVGADELSWDSFGEAA